MLEQVQPRRGITRRQFLAAAAATGAATGIPPLLHALARSAMVHPRARPVGGGGPAAGGAPAAGGPGALEGAGPDAETAAATNGGADPTFYFFDADQAATCAAICARVVPSTDPVTGAPVPGATEAQAVVFIDRFLAAFRLPATVADNPAVYLHGPHSNRNPLPDYATGAPKTDAAGAPVYPDDDFLTTTGPDAGQAHFVELDDLQEFSWRVLVEGLDAALAWANTSAGTLDGLLHGSGGTWLSQVRAGTIPGPDPRGLQQLYAAGLAAFDAYASQAFGVPFAQATPAQQDAMLEAAGNPAVSQVPLPSPPGAPPDAKTLYPYVVAHTFEGCYGLPEYRWLDGNPLWAEIGWDGDTQPLGNSVYDRNLYGPGEGPNAGFGQIDGHPTPAGVPRGGYREYRPVSFVAPGSSVLDASAAAFVVDALERLGVLRTSAVRP